MKSARERHISITIIEDNRYVREGWIAVFENVPNFTVRGAFSNCEKAFRSDSIAESDVVLMDIGLPGMSGIEGAKYITEHYPGTATVMCTVFEDDQKIFDALCAGAVGYLLKEVDSADLIRAIRDATAGGSPMTPDIARKVIAHFQKPPARPAEPIETLTERERETLDLLAQGKSYAEIGEHLFVSIDGVRSRIRTIYVKLQSHSRGEAVAKGLAHRIINLPEEPPASPR
jgi:DNA-binding NarL/FixJ family response regulator